MYAPVKCSVLALAAALLAAFAAVLGIVVARLLRQQHGGADSDCDSAVADE